MIGSYVLIEISTLLGSVSAIGTFELRLLAALVPRVSDQSGAVLVTLAACLATIRKLDPLRHPKAGQVLDQRYHRVVAIPLKVLRHSHARDGYVNNKRRKKNLSNFLRARLCENNEKEGKRDKFNFHPRCRLRARLGEGSGGDARCDGVSGPRWLPPRYRSKGTSSSTRIRTLVSYAREARSNDRTWRNTLDRN